MDDPTGLGALALRRAMDVGRLTAAALMEATLARIARVNPGLNAIVALRDPAALRAEAAAADRVPVAARGPLHGLPMAVKDLVGVAGIRSTWGSPILADNVPAQDDMLAARLRAAGAILIGKTNTPEFGLGSHSYNPVHGVTGNPYAPERTAGGSSGGAAAALAARMLALADGSDMMGSLRNPAGWCNVYGFRPTYGRVPVDPVGDTFLHQLATDGPMARSIEDLALLLEVLAVPDPRLPHGRPSEPFLAALDRPAGRLRIGWLGDWGAAWPMENGILSLCRNALDDFPDATVEDVPPPFAAARLWDSWTTLRSWAVAARLGVFHADAGRRALLKPEAIWEIERGLSFSAMQVHRASVVRSEWNAVAAGLFQRFDLLALPVAQVWPFPKGWDWPKSVAGRAMDTYHRWMEVVVPASLLGLPTLAAPVGFGPQGLPMGVQLIGPRGADAAVLRAGQAWHRATDWPGRVPPAGVA
ncbi:MAG: amidase [Gemmobacter sp.]|uniref:amidase n=1 Tax=Gemmobacter sp. TaxID=1898957 RepID=UPI00391B079C